MIGPRDLTDEVRDKRSIKLIGTRQIEVFPPSARRRFPTVNPVCFSDIGPTSVSDVNPMCFSDIGPTSVSDVNPITHEIPMSKDEQPDYRGPKFSSQKI